MRLEFELTQEDYINYHIAYSKKSPSIRRSIMIQRMFGPAIFIIAPFIVIKFSEIPLWYWIIIFGITSIAWFIFFPKYSNWDMKRRLKKMLKEGSNENLFNTRSVTLTESGITEASSIGQSKINWDKIVSLEETDDYIYIYISSVSAHIIPKRVFENITEQRFFIEEISKQIKRIKEEDYVQKD